MAISSSSVALELLDREFVENRNFFIFSVSGDIRICPDVMANGHAKRNAREILQMS